MVEGTCISDVGISGVPHSQQHIAHLPTVATLYILHVLSPQSKYGITCYTAATECTAALIVWVLALSWSAGAPPQTPHSSGQCETMTLCLLNTRKHTHTVGDILYLYRMHIMQLFSELYPAHSGKHRVQHYMQPMSVIYNYMYVHLPGPTLPSVRATTHTTPL